MSDERRHAGRTPARIMTFMKFPKTGKVQRVLTKDISAVGLRIVTEGVLESGTTLEVEMTLPDGSPPIGFTVEVVWSQAIQEPRKSYEIPTAETGVKFVTIDPKQLSLIRQFVAFNTPLPEPGEQ